MEVEYGMNGTVKIERVSRFSFCGGFLSPCGFVTLIWKNLKTCDLSPFLQTRRDALLCVCAFQKVGSSCKPTKEKNFLKL